MGLWSLGTGAISTVYPTADLLIGSNATTSAQFAITGVASDTPVATIAGSTNNGLVLSADDSTIQSLRNNTLTLGGDTTGNISLAENTSVTGTLTSSGLITGSNGLTVSSGNLAITSGLLSLNGTTRISNAGVGTFATNTQIATQTFTSNSIADSGALTISSGGAGDITLTSAGGNILSSSPLNIGGAAQQAYNFFAASTAGNANAVDASDLYIQDDLEVDGTIYAATDVIVGGSSVCLSSGTNCPSGATTYWQQNQNALSPTNASVYDLLLGSSTTSSAKFAVIGINGTNTPVASISATSGTDATKGLYISGDGSIQTVRNNTLTLGGDTTGDISIAGPTNISGVTSIIGNTDITGTLSSTNSTTLGTGTGGTNTFGSGASSINTIGSVTTPGALTLHGATTLDNTFTVSGSNLTSLGGNLTVTGTSWTATPTISGLITATSGLTSNGTLTVANGQTFDANGIVNLGDDGENVVIDSDTWNVTGAGVVSGLTGLRSSGTITFSGFTGANNGGVIYANSSGVLSQTAAGSDTQCLLGGSTPSWGSCASGGGGGAFAISE